MEANISLIDCAIEVLDARAPLATKNPDLTKMMAQKPVITVLNKADLANAEATAAWIHAFEKQGKSCIAFSATKSGGNRELLIAIQKATAPVVEKWEKRGAKKTVRLMVCGIPNVGKSSLINNLSRAGRAKTGSRPGVTRGKQWVKLTPYLEMMDTPGVLWPRLSDVEGAKLLAYLNAINDQVLEYQEIGAQLGALLFEKAPELLIQRYQMMPEEGPADVLKAVARMRGLCQADGEFEERKAASILMEEFRSGKIGRITLEEVERN